MHSDECEMSKIMHKGSCLCGAVRFTYAGKLTAPSACHCNACRKHSGHFEASTDVPRDKLTITGDKNLKWFHSSKKVRRGFCDTCGSTLFWDPTEKEWTAIAMGAFDTPTEVKLKGHIFTAEKGDYYDLSDELPHNER